MVEVQNRKEQVEVKKPVSDEEVFDASKDVVLFDDEGDRIACMREYVFLHLATNAN